MRVGGNVKIFVFNRLFGFPILSGADCGKMEVHFEDEKGNDADAEAGDADLVGGPRGSVQRKDAAFSRKQYSKLELYFCRPRELDHIHNPLQYHRDYVISSEEPQRKMNEKDLTVLCPADSAVVSLFRDQTFARHYVYLRNSSSGASLKKTRLLRWKPPSVFDGERIFWLLHSDALQIWLCRLCDFIFVFSVVSALCEVSREFSNFAGFWLYALLASESIAKLACHERDLGIAFSSLKRKDKNGQLSYRANCAFNRKVLGVEGLPVDYMVLEHVIKMETPGRARSVFCIIIF